MQINKFLSRRVVAEASHYIFSGRTSFRSILVVKRELNVSVCKAMAQTSITSFFKFTPLKTVEKQQLKSTVEKNEDNLVKEETSPTTSDKKEKRSKRPRLESSGSESEKLNRSKSSPAVSLEKKKKIKRPRIDSSESEPDPSKSDLSSPKPESKSSPESDVEPSPKCIDTSSDEKLKIKLEETDSPKTYASPKSKKGKNKVLKETNKSKTQEKTTPKSKKASITKSLARSPSPVSKKVKKEVNHDKSIEESKDVENSEPVPVPETEYNPAKAKYHPIKDACWAKGKPVPYLALAKTFEAIEPISARLKIIEILSNYFRSVIVLTPEDLLASVYMCLNQLAPAYHSLELGIAETYLMKAVGVCTGRTLTQMRSAQQAGGGDLGAAAERARRDQRTMFPQPPLSARHVFATFKQIAHMTGQASVNKKIAKIQSLYVASRYSEARYLIRSLEGKLRIGLAEQSVLQALALATAMTPPSPSGTHVLDASKGLSADKFKSRVDEHSMIIKTTYCECPNYDAIVPVMLEHGVQALPDHCKLTVGVPLKPMLAHPTKGVHEVFNRFEGEEFTCEWKYDGERAQIHVPGDQNTARVEQASIFSRNQENNTSKYPDVIRRLPSLLKESVSNCVLDCEAVAYDTVNKQILPFQILSTRKRKDAAEADIKVQVCVFVFDLLYLNGEPLVRKPLAARRQLLRDNFNEVEGEWQFATSKDCKDMEEVQLFLDEAVKGSCEGLMVKTLQGDNAKYDIARRSHNWLKLKKDYLEGVGDTIDVVVIGAYCGRGKRRATYGGFLAACRDTQTDTYQALCKLGTGFSDEDLTNFTEILKQHEIPQPRSYYTYDSSHVPDAWFAPVVVWEVRCADLSLSPSHRAAIGLVDPDKGISLRFPRFVRVREDKSPEQATEAQQIAEMYLAQDQVKNTTAKPNYNMDDFY